MKTEQEKEVLKLFSRSIYFVPFIFVCRVSNRTRKQNPQSAYNLIQMGLIH